MTIENITIKSPATSPNTDGIDPSGWNYLIRNCTIDVRRRQHRHQAKRSAHAGQQGLHDHELHASCTGTECRSAQGTNGGVENVKVSNCTFDNTDAGIRIKTLRGRGGLLQNITYENLTMNKVKNPIYIIDYYPEREAPKDPSTEQAQPVDDKTPVNKNIVIRNMTATDCPTAGIIRGLPEMPIDGMTLSNVTISAQEPMKIYSRERNSL